MLAAQLVARKTSIPWISTVLAPMSFFSAYDPPVLPFWPFLSHVKLFGPALMKAAFKFWQQRYRPHSFDNLRTELEIPDYGNPIFAGQHSPALSLALFSSLFAPSQPDWPPQTRVTGFPFYDGGHKLAMPVELTNFLKQGPPPIIFTLGSSAVWVARDFFHQSITASMKIGRRAVLLIGDERNRPNERLPEEIIAVNYAPFEALLPRACAMVHHGGVGTTSEGLRAGIPTLIVPFAFDQADNAAHAQRLGVSRTLQRNQYLAARVAKELKLLVDQPAYAAKAQAVAGQLQSENGAAVACNLIEEFLKLNHRIKEESGDLLYASRN
jgi:UDP:flavonoid glycosyltransferase YjiC (YdhE family)